MEIIKMICDFCKKEIIDYKDKISLTTWRINPSHLISEREKFHFHKDCFTLFAGEERLERHRKYREEMAKKREERKKRLSENQSFPIVTAKPELPEVKPPKKDG